MTLCVQFAELAFDGLHDNLLLFVHDQTNPNTLQRLTSASQLSDGVLVEVVLSGNEPPVPSDPATYIEIYIAPKSCNESEALEQGD